jgi:two-component system, NtrC family, sensor kinase
MPILTDYNQPENKKEERMSRVPPQNVDLAWPELLYNLGISLSAELNLPDLLNKVTDAAVGMTHASEGRLLLQQPETGDVVIQSIHDQESAAAVSANLPTRDVLALHVLDGGGSLVLDPDEPSNLGGGEYTSDRSILAVPLITKARTIGVLIVGAKRAGESFTQHDRDMLLGLADYAAIAIENARLYAQALDRTFQLGLLVESANALSWSLDLGRVLNAVARHMMRSLEAAWCTISSWSQETDTISQLANYRLLVWKNGMGPRLAIEDHPKLRAALEDSAILLADSSDPWVSGRGFSHLLEIPLQHEGKLVGLAELCYLQPSKEPGSDTIRRCISSALAIGPLLTNSRPDDWQDRLVEAARSLTATSGGNFCTLYTPSGSSTPWQRLLDYGSGVWIEDPGPAIAVADYHAANIVLREQRTAVIRSTDTDLTTEERRLLNSAGMGTQVLLPLVFKTKTVGLVQLYDPDPAREYSDRDMGLAYALANQAAVALENAHLVRDLQLSLEQQKAMQGQLVRAARMSALGELTAVIAHQINNPLTTILGDAEILVQDTSPDSPLRDSALAIRRAGQRAKRVVERLLSMARSESEFKPIDVNHTITEAVALVGSQLKQANIDLQLNLETDLPAVRAIPGHLEDVWMNLIINSRDAITVATEDRGMISISSNIDEAKRWVVVSIGDNGTGLSPDDLSRIFDPMFTTKPHGKGTGLGLYICRQIVTEHGGQIDVTSTQGQGARVVVQLPLDLHAPQESQPWLTL